MLANRIQTIARCNAAHGTFSFGMQKLLSTSANAFCLSNRKVLRVSGADARKFVQGLTTNDINALKAPNDCIATAFLTTKGRIFAPALAYYQADDAVLIEVHDGIANDLERHMSMYRLRAKAKIEKTDYLVQIQKSLSESAASPSSVSRAVDPRVPELGVRALVSASQGATADPASTRLYDLRSLALGVAQGLELTNRIPLECNLDLLHYIAFDKGCYIGQELTARTKYKGLVRKRMVPVFLSPQPFSPPAAFSFASEAKIASVTSLEGASMEGVIPAHSKLRNAAGVVGEVVAVNHSVGLALLHLDAMLAAEDCQFAVHKVDKKSGEGEGEEAPEDDVGEVVGFAQPFRPTWFPVPLPAP